MSKSIMFLINDILTNIHTIIYILYNLCIYFSPVINIIKIPIISLLFPNKKYKYNIKIQK